MFFAKSRVGAAAVLAALSLAPAAQAVKFNLIDTGGAAEGTLARMGFDVATRYWSSVLTDNLTVNLEIGFSSLGPDILGQTGSNYGVITVPTAYNALKLDQTSQLDRTATANLPQLSGVRNALTMVVNDYDDPATKSGYTDTRTRVDNDQSIDNRDLAVTTANLKALGISIDANGDALDPTAVDGSVTFNSDLAFDFDPADGIDAHTSDFIAVAIHEIGHALGFVSGVDDFDLVTNPGSPVIGTYMGNDITGAEALELGLLTPDGRPNYEGLVVGSTLDLFRYNTLGQLDWSTSDATKIFSVDGGASMVYGKGAFSLGAFNGDGNQASHWLQPADQSTRDGACSNFLGIMNPYICTGQGDAVTALDLAAFDSIGWNLAAGARDNSGYIFTTAQAFDSFGGVIPEPETWEQFLLGFGLLGGVARRKREAAAAKPFILPARGRCHRR